MCFTHHSDMCSEALLIHVADEPSGMELWMAVLLYQLEPPGPWMGSQAGGPEEPGELVLLTLVEHWNTDASLIFSAPHHARLLGHFVNFLLTKNCQMLRRFLGKLLFHRKKYEKC